MKNKKIFYSIIVGMIIYMVLSWVIVAGNFANTEYTSTGFNQFGLFDFILAPLHLFNYFVITMTKKLNGNVQQVGYGNIIMAFISIGIFYGVLNETNAYSKLINDIKEKVYNKRTLFLLLFATFYCVFSAFTGLNLVLFMLLPLVAAILFKLNYNKMTAFMATVGAILVGQLGSLYNPNINGLNRVLFQISLNSNIIPRIVFTIMLLIVFLSVLYFSNNKDSEQTEEILLLNEIKEKKIRGKKSNNSNGNYYTIIIVMCLITTILCICMYNWYYMFGNTAITNGYNKVIGTNIQGYTFMKNILGMSESFGYWTGFTMSALLILSSIVIAFLYNLKLDKIFDGAKNGIIQLMPTIFYSILSLSVIVISLNNSNNFIYTIIDKIFDITKNNQILGLLSSSILHNLFINDYFALVSSLSLPIVSIYGYENLEMSVLIAQIGHGLSSFITPFNIYLIAGLTYFNISYTKWLRYIWKFMFILIFISFVVLFIVSSF